MQHEPIKVRKPDFDFNASIARYYLGGNPLETHFFNALNLLFPAGERFFVRSVHDHVAEVRDQALLRDIRAFAGQEGQHANQHQRFFEVLEAQGYRIRSFLRWFEAWVRFGNRLPRGLRLSMTAGAEHYTASMAALVFEHEMVADCQSPLRELIEWHALEEIEHKHVAYDALMATHRFTYPLRMLGFAIGTLAIAAFTLAGVRMLVRQDVRAGRLDGRALRDARRTIAGGKDARFRSAFRRALVRYLAPGFHPSQKDDRPLLARLAERPTLAAE